MCRHLTEKVKPVKSLRNKKHWSQEQLAQLSGLNVRTIQRVEKGQSAGTETLKSLAAVFEISIDELVNAIENENHAQQKENDITLNDQPEAKAPTVDPKQATRAQTNKAQTDKAIEKVKSIKYFYASSAFLIAIFLLFMLPNYNDGENLGSLTVVFLSFAAIIAVHAFMVFEPFGEKWEKEKLAQLMVQQSEESRSGLRNAEHKPVTKPNS